MLKLGMAKQKMTPPAAHVNLAGQNFYRFSTHVESDIYANAFAAESDGEQLIICSCDLVGIYESFLEEVKRLVSERGIGIDPDRIILCATHTHTAPYVWDVTNANVTRSAYLPDGYSYTDTYEVDPSYWMGDKTGPYMAACVAEAICAAWAKRQKGYFAPSFGRVPLAQCRRTAYKDGSAINYGVANREDFACIQGGVDTGMELLYLYDEARKPMGVIANIACPSQSVETCSYISSDFWGKARDFIEAELGEDFVTVALCGAAGDMAPRDNVRRFWGFNPDYPRRSDAGELYSVESCTDKGETLAIEILRRLRKVTELKDYAEIRYHKSRTVTLPYLTITDAQYAAAKQEVLDYVENCGRTELNDTDMGKLAVPLATIARYENPDKEWDTPVHVARFDDIAFASNPFELFLEFGDRIKARSRATQTFLIQLSMARGAYLPTKLAQESGGYGAVPHVVKVGYDGGEILVEETLKRIADLF